MPKDAETLPAPETKRIDELERNNQELRSQVDELRRKVELLLGRKDETEMTEEQKAIFNRLDAILGSDPADRKQAETILRELEGIRTIKAMVTQLHTFLKRRELGVKIDEKIVATTVWQPALGSANGGYMRFAYFDSSKGRTVYAGSFTQFPIMKLVPRPDGRRTRHQ